jgi:hypothetical protein
LEASRGEQVTLNDRKNLAARLTDLAKRLPTLDPPNTSDHNFHRTGLLLIRAGLACINDGDHARHLASDWSARGYPNGSGDGSRSSSSDTSTERAAINGSDHWESTVVMLDLERSLLADNAYSIEHRIANVVKVAPNEGRRSTLIDCANSKNCDVTMTGLGEDRPREGRCERCYRFRKRTGRDWTARAEVEV